MTTEAYRHMRGRAARMAALVVLSASVAAGQAPVPPDGPAFPVAPAATAPATGRSRDVLPAERAADVDAALDWSDAEGTILDAVRDGSDTLDEPAAYVLLRRAAMLPDGPEVVRRADRVAMDNLLRRPRDYRGRLVRMTVELYDIELWHGGQAFTRWWGDKPAWFVRARELESGRSVILLLSDPPAGYEIGRRLELNADVAGLFYKTVRREVAAEAADAGSEQLYAVLVAPRLLWPSAPPTGESDVWRGYLLLAGLLVLLLVVFYVLKKQLARRPGPSRPYRSLRDGQPEPPPPEPVDADLQRELEDYQARHRNPAGGPQDTTEPPS